MNINNFKDAAIVNDLSFKFKDKEFSILMDNNSYVAIDDNGNVKKFDKYNDLYKDLDDLIDNWMIEGQQIKDIVQYIELI